MEDLHIGGHLSDVENDFYIPYDSVGEKNNAEIQSSQSFQMPQSLDEAIQDYLSP